MTTARIGELISTLQLRPHPEGGSYHELYRSPLTVEPDDGRGPRAALTVIYYLLPAGARSRWHRVRSDEVWQHCEGAPLELLQMSPDEWRLERTLLGSLQEHGPVRVVPAQWWQAAHTLGEYSLVSCTVAPGFEFGDFELLADQPTLAAEVARVLPEVFTFV